VISRAEAIVVANALIALTVGASLGDLSSLSELVNYAVLPFSSNFCAVIRDHTEYDVFVGFYCVMHCVHVLL